MDAVGPMLLKRKDAEPWVDGVPVPATKMRRLDAEVPPVEAGAGVVQLVEPSAGVVQLVGPGACMPPQPFEVEEVGMNGEVAPVVVAPANDERAIVVYQPAEAARNLLRGPLRPEVALRVSPDWIHGLKSTHGALFEELASRDENSSLAMVPWAPAHAHVAQAATATTSSSSAPATEMMDADQDVDGASMEVELQEGGGRPAPPAGVALQGHAFQQQHWPPQQLQVPAASYQPSAVTWSW